MKKIVQVAEGAYFVPSYSEQTVLLYRPGVTTLLGVSTPPIDVSADESEPDYYIDEIEASSEPKVD